MMVQLVLRWHPAGIKHDHLPAKVVITYGRRHGLALLPLQDFTFQKHIFPD